MHSNGPLCIYRTVGQVVSKENATAAPNLIIRGSAAAEATPNGPFNVTTIKYTVLAIDGDVAGSNSTKGMLTSFPHVIYDSHFYDCRIQSPLLTKRLE